MYERLILDLRNTLSNLYPDSAHAKRIAEEALIPVVFIDWTSSPVEVWGQTVKEAERRGAIQALIDIAASEYKSGPYHDELQRIRQGLAWYRSKAEPSVIPVWQKDDDPGKPLGERVASLEATMRFLASAMVMGFAGIYLTLALVIYLIMTRGN